MSVSDLDLPLLPSAEQIRRREFATVRRGYDPDQVRTYLSAVAAQVETLEKSVRDVKLGVAAQEQISDDQVATVATAPPAAPADPYEELGKRIAALIETADTEAKRLVEEAKAEASRMLQQGRSEADRIRLDAQSRAEEARQEGAEALERAKLEAERTLANLSTRREDLVSQLHEMQSRLLSVARDLEATIDQREADGPPAWASDPAPPAGADAAADPSPGATAEPESSSRGGAAEPTSSSGDDEIVDPRYEDLWVSTETVELPQLTSIDFDFEDDAPDAND
jgi:DivIVA domain-containing protein